MTKPDTPFPKHWLYYIVLKYGVIAAAVLVTLLHRLPVVLKTKRVRDNEQA